MLSSMSDQKDTNPQPPAERVGEEKPATPAKKTSPLKDWKALGEVRDYFVEQMKQDKDW